MFPFLEMGFSRSGDFSLRAIDLLRLINLVARSQANKTATIPAYKNCLAFVAINVVNPSTGLSAVQRRNSDAIGAQDLRGMLMNRTGGCCLDIQRDQRNFQLLEQNEENHSN